MKRKAAFFDICQTLVWTTTITDFTENFFLEKSRNAKFKRSAWCYHVGFKILRKLHLVSPMMYRNHYVKLYQGYRAEDLQEVAERYAVSLERRLKQKTFEKFQELKRAGYDMYLVTAGLEIYLQPFAKKIGATLIATELETDDQGVYTGNMKGIDCIGDGKVVKIQETVGDIDWKSSCAFGNDAPDIPMLSRVGNAWAVNPDEKLLEQANREGWRILDTGPAPKKIMYLITTTHTGGAEITLQKIVMGIDRTQFLPIVVSVRPIQEIGIEMRDAGIDVRDIGMKHQWYFWSLINLFMMMRKIKPEFLHTFLSHSNIIGRIIGRMARVPVIISSIRNEYFGGRLREWLMKHTDSLADWTTILSDKAAERMVRLGIVRPQKYEIIYNGFDMQNFPHRDTSIRTNPVIITAGRLTKQKGFTFAIEAMVEIIKKYPQATLLILGVGEQEQELKSLVKKLGLENHVTLAGVKTHEETMRYFTNADVFLSASLWEGFGNVIIEAMACGLPAVVTNVCGAAMVIEEGVSGHIIEPGNVDAIVQGANRVLGLSPDDRARMSTAARDTVADKFSLETMIKNYEKLYERFLK